MAHRYIDARTHLKTTPSNIISYIKKKYQVIQYIICNWQLYHVASWHLHANFRQLDVNGVGNMLEADVKLTTTSQLDLSFESRLSIYICSQVDCQCRIFIDAATCSHVACITSQLDCMWRNLTYLPNLTYLAS